MNQDILCSWLGLGKTAWPPDPWTLLGLAPGEGDQSLIEERVHDRMTKLRHYQLSYPEEATEGMNRLAEAFIALTQVSATAAPMAAVSESANGARSKAETTEIDKTSVDWRDEPPPVREDSMAPTPMVLAEEGAEADQVLVSQPFAAPTKPQRQGLPAAVIRELAVESEGATSNLATLDTVIERVESTRRLLHAWERVGRQFKSSAKKFGPKESDQFAKRLKSIADTMQAFPAILGHPGMPGYRVVVQARLNISLAAVRGMSDDQREALLADWHDGQQILHAHRRYLHKLFKSMRRRTWVGLTLHFVRAFLNDYPRATLSAVSVLILLALVLGVFFAIKGFG